MIATIDLICAFWFLFVVFKQSTSELQPRVGLSAAKTESERLATVFVKDGNKSENVPNSSDNKLPSDRVIVFNNLNSGKDVTELTHKALNINSDNNRSTSNHDLSKIVLEGGGGIPQQIFSTVIPNVDQMGVDISHSKGRKGVQYPGSSVVARKGVNQLGEVLLANNSALISESPLNESHSTNTYLPLSTDKSTFPKNNVTQKLKAEQNQLPVTNIKKVGHAKKPPIVSDAKDPDEFEEYTIIKTSTTGEDYVVIGIVIVIGIWFSVFGALIFYRRAGEYWDRRHYRRMDFLVEGMYND